MGDWSRMRMWALAAGVAMLGFNAMVALGWLQAGNSIYAGPRVIVLSHALGGLMFGFGMVLASGCGSKTLVRVGGGNLKSLVVFVVLGSQRVRHAEGPDRGVARRHRRPRGRHAADGAGPADPVGARQRRGARHVRRFAGPAGRRRAAGVGAGASRGAARRRAARWRGHRTGRGRAVVGVGAPRPRGRTSADAAGEFSRHQLTAHGVAELRVAARLHHRLAALLQRREQGADHRHRQHGRRGARQRCRGTGHAQLPLGGFSRCRGHRQSSGRCAC